MKSSAAVTCSWLLILGGISARAADEALPAGVLQDLESATVLIKVTDGAQQSSGSGFLVDANNDRGYIVTAAHVCHLSESTERANQNIKVVLNSGSKDEREIPAEVVAQSANADLAVLQIVARDLPKKLLLSNSTAVRETLPVLVLGFPFGTDLSIQEGNPTVTISNARISSLRRDSAQKLSLIQLDGNLNPGNSGGPVVGQKGQLIGISIARIDNAGIGFAIPTQTLAEILKGEVDEIVVENTTVDGKPALKVQCRLLDPFERVKSLSVSLAAAVQANTAGAANTKTNAYKKRVALERNGSLATATIPMSAKVKAVDIEVTLSFDLVDGQVVEKSPFALKLTHGRLEGDIVRTSLFVPGGAKSVVARAKQQDETAKRAEFGADVRFMAPAADGSGMFVIRKSQGTNHLYFWDPRKNEAAAEISVPRSPSHVALQGEHLIVTCPDSSVVAILNSKTKRITSSIELELPNQMMPIRVCATNSKDFAYILCSPNGDEPRRNTAAVEVNLKSGKYTTMTTGDIEYAAVMNDTIVTQRNFGGSPSGMVNRFSVKDLRNPEGKKSAEPGEHQGFGPHWVTSKGDFVFSNELDKTLCISVDGKQTRWTADGVVLAAWPDNSAFLLTSGARNSNTDKWPLKAVDQGGTTLWDQEIALEKPISMWITQAILVNNSPPFLIIGTAQQGSSLSFALSNNPLAISRCYLLVGKESNYVVFGVTAFSGEVVGRFAFRVNERKRLWYYAKIPDRKQGPKIPDQIFVGEKFDFQPEVPVTAGLYSLKSAPQGMLCDPNTARIQWQPDSSSLGTYEVEILKIENGKETSVLKFALRVKSKRA